ncbi:nicotinate-nucleotide--dimethylbenzimidazole phosphoribosyltransferase [Streptomyces sp. WMMC897]|uniref:nicotinate-nucleotide--dimethylbenzimidazole phosphoribosyltransferase n=1 Tax=Streptomyces sp. WMMC897 TaxID=3014782 RepID=UPI0022B68CFC|nr:nicotinate-nucleotide--dimethylbenzimidazole phosphoribosyltransferase [Streptomyces sp. WMMC897]MCZ7413335.1 nicotinate-nucleotide--dimethylbenzimidazole phosphoribosyltransferase [Streptomyces sp. WMMC897]
MTDTGQVPGEGLPENAGALPEQTGTPASGTYTFADPAQGGAPGYEDDMLLMPGAQGAWNEAAHHEAAHHEAGQPGHAAGPLPGPHETDGRDSGFHEYGAVRESGQDTGHTAHPGQPGAAAPRRPLHLGPPVPEQSGAVRSLADRGPTPSAVPPPAGQPGAAHAGPAHPAPEPAPYPAEQGGPEYFETGQVPVATPEGGFPGQAEQGSATPPMTPVTPVQPGAWSTPVAAPYDGPPAADAETVGPSVGAPQPGPDPAGGALPASEAVPAPEGAPAPEAAPVAEAQPPAPQGPVPAPHAMPPSGPEPTAGPQPGESGAAAEEPQAPAPPQPAPAPEPTPEPVAEAVQPAAEPAPEAAHEPAGHLGEGAAPEPVAAPAEGAQPVEAAPSVPGPRSESPAEPVEQPAPQPAPVLVTAAPQPDAPEPVPAPSPEAGAPAAPQPAEAPVGQPGDAVEAAPDPAPEPVAATDPVTDAAPAAAPEAPEAPEAPGAGPAPEAEPAPAPGEGTGPEGPDAAQGEAVPEPAPEAVAVPQGPPAPGYPDAEREALHKVMRERRDIRNGFRSDPIPHEVLLRVLEAAHTAPSVGHSQPWDFVIIRSGETRRAMHELAVRQREAYAKSLPRARAKQFKELKIEAILDTPVNIVVTADPTRGGRHTLGRHTQPQMAPYSSALAVENLWLAARAEGLGVGWVSFFDEREMVTALGLPEHLEVVAYLCVGYVDAFPDEPELAQAGWSKRRPLSWVVHEESYGRRVLPGGEPSDLLAETLAGIRPLDAKALGEAWERQKRMTKPSGALGMLEIISAQLSGLARKCPPPVPEPAAVAVFAGDHGVHAQGVTAWPQEVTGQMVANFLGGGAVCNAFAGQVGAEVCVVDVGVAAELPASPGLLPRKVRPGTADFTVGPAMDRAEAVRAVEIGIETARDLVTAGNRALLTGEMGIANTTVSAALISAFTGTDPSEVTGRGTGINDDMHAHKVEVVRRALELHRPDPADPVGVLAALGGLEHAAMVGLILGGASLRTPVILDGVSAGAAALVARAIAPEALAACIAGHRSAEPGHVAALTKLGLRPLVDLDLRLGEGTGALLALPVVQSAARAMHEVATFDAAGVTEKN